MKSAAVPLGQPAPDFNLAGIDGLPHTLAGLRGRKVVLVFYRGHW
jgi:peroxiredoxin